MKEKTNKTPFLSSEFWSKAWNEAKARSTVLVNQVNDDSGFRPQLRIFKYRTKVKKLAQQLIKQYEDYFRIFVNLQKKHKDIIQDYFNGISEQGIIKAQTTREIYVMWWDVKDKKEE